MAKHDIVVLNSTSSGFETDLGNNVARIKGDADNLFSVSDGSSVDKFVVNSVGDSITVSGDLTLTGNLSSSLSSTASFGKIDVTNLVGDASQMTDVNQIGHVYNIYIIYDTCERPQTEGFESIPARGRPRATSRATGRPTGAKILIFLPCSLIFTAFQLAGDHFTMCL